MFGSASTDDSNLKLWFVAFESKGDIYIEILLFNCFK